MPPKLEPKKCQENIEMKSSTETDSSKTKDMHSEEEDPQLGPSTITDFSKNKLDLKVERPPPTKEEIVRSPVCRLASDAIVERSSENDPVVSEVEKLQKAKEPFEKILMFHLGKRRFTNDQRKSWLLKINGLRPDRSLSSISMDYETEASKEVAHLKFSEEEISNFCDRLEKDDYWDFTESKEASKTESKTETSSDSEIEMTESEMKSPRLTPRRSPRHLGPRRQNSWKEFKRGKSFEATYFKQQIEHKGVKKVIKKIVKAIWRKKKQQYIEKNEYSSIEVGKNEVQDLLFEAVGFIEKRYLGQIKAAARQIYPSEDHIFERDCESGTYDSQDDWLPNNESVRSRINKMSVSVPTSTLQEFGLLDILIATLPMTLNDTDPDATLEFVEILKMARNRVPEHIAIKTIPTMSKSQKAKHTSGYTVVCTALVEPPPDLERLARTGAKDYLKQIPSPTDEESEAKSISDISNGVKDSLHLESRKSESESSIKLDSTKVSGDVEIIDESSIKLEFTQASGDVMSTDESSIKIDSTETSGDIKFIDESSAEETEDLLRPEAAEQFKRDRSPESPDTQSKKKSPEQ